MKIGIITLYHNSLNYGGNLQAYALCRFFLNKNIQVEQIAFNLQSIEPKKNRIQRLLSKGVFGILKVIINKCISSIKAKYVNLVYNIDKIMSKRRNAFEDFNQNKIPHSTQIYDKTNIQECVENYDVFITGSDQVWNFNWYCKEYFLDFVPEYKKKYSYAASFSMDKLTEAQEAIVSKSLKDYRAISVRESEAIDLLDKLTDKEVVQVVDPTLLLDYEEWNKVCSDRLVREEYVFGYFLGENIKAVKLAREFAHNRGLKFVMIPFPSGYYHMKDFKRSDIKIEDASPEDFLSLIKYASYVFTDSFHAVVFSYIFKKQFFVFNRDGNGSMNSRITSLTEMFDLRNRFVATTEQENMEYIETINAIDYNLEFKKYQDCKAKSIKFIQEKILQSE